MPTPLKALTASFIANRDNLLAYIAAFVQQPEAAEDIFQDVWLKLAEAAEKGVEIQDAKAWCRGTARNLILHHWRERRTARVVADERILDLADRAFQEDEQAPEPWTGRGPELIHCVQALPDHARDLLRLKFFDNLSSAQIAERLRQSCEAVRKAIYRVKKSLEECVEKRMAEGTRP